MIRSFWWMFSRSNYSHSKIIRSKLAEKSSSVMEVTYSLLLGEINHHMSTISTLERIHLIISAKVIFKKSDPLVGSMMIWVSYQPVKVVMFISGISLISLKGHQEETEFLIKIWISKVCRWPVLSIFREDNMRFSLAVMMEKFGIATIKRIHMRLKL